MPSATNAISGADRFQALWRRCLIEGAADDSDKIHQLLLDAYREPQRHYHTLAHIEQCMGMFDDCKALVSNADALELAVWFHDAVFEPGQADNERRSADLYLELSRGVHDDELRGLVERLIMATLHDLDDIAYVRFASVYREFKDVNDFVSELKSLLSKQ